MQYSIRVYKEYFNFACSHFLIFPDGSREPLHGHNYRVRVAGNADDLIDDMVFDFLKIKPIVREICNSLDHRLILPGHNEQLMMKEDKENWVITTPDKSYFSFPKKDVLVLPISNSSAERFAIYIAKELKRLVYKEYSYSFKSIEVEVEESIGQSAIVTISGDDK